MLDFLFPILSPEHPCEIVSVERGWLAEGLQVDVMTKWELELLSPKS